MAARFWIGGGTNTNWNASPSTNWAATSGGTVRVAAPTSSDNVTFDGAGANGNTASVVSATNACLTLTFTGGYTNTVTINSNQAIQVAGNFTDNTAHSWTTLGTGNTLQITAAATIASGGKTYPGNVAFTGSNTKTISGNWTIGGTLTALTTTTTINKTASEVITSAGLTLTGAIAGNIDITLSGGTWSGGGVGTMTGTLNFAGNVIISGAVTFNGSGATLKYTSGTITTTGSTVSNNNLSGTVTWDTNGMTFNSVVFGNTQTNSLTSLLTAATITVNNAITFTGAAGFTCNTLTTTGLLNAAANITLVHAVTYTVNSAITFTNNRSGATYTFISDDGTIQAIMTVLPAATCNVCANFTRIDASAGRPINTFSGTVTTCNNIFSFSDALTPASIRMVRAGATY